MKLTWDAIGERFYETGVDHGVLYPVVNGAYPKGYAWNGLTNISESPSGAEQTPLYADNIKYLTLTSAEEFGLTIEAYTYPDEWEECDGTATLANGVKIGQQARKKFGLCYRTKKGNDVDGDAHGEKLHLVYGCSASPSERGYSTVNDSPEAITFSWTVTTTPITLEGYSPVALITIDSTKVDSAKYTQLKDILYGTNGSASYNEVTPVGTENPSEEGWYELVDDAYILSTDTSVNSSKSYYEKTTTGATDARLPLPDEVKRMFAAG